MPPLNDDGYAAALSLLHDAATPDGFVAATEPRRNYRRVWARDAVVCGLAGLLADDARLAAALRASLETLARAQGPDGQIPSNVRPGQGDVDRDVSYGGVCGRVDAVPWFIIGVYTYAGHTGDVRFAKAMGGAIERALALLRSWEFNARGLVYVPQGGDWADEYVLRGYVLYDQLLRLWALRLHARFTGDGEGLQRATSLARLLDRTYWPRSDGDGRETTYHPTAYTRHLRDRGEPDHWLAALTPGGYTDRFDAWSNALAVLLGLGDEARRHQALDAGQRVAAERPGGLVPAFWPPITRDDAEWPLLRSNYRDRFNNRPHHYHNGGLWPVVNGWWGMALAAAGRTDEAATLLERLHRANRSDDGRWRFPEYLHGATGEPGGTPRLAWSAAGTVLLACTLDGGRLRGAA